MAAHLFNESGQMQEVDIPDIFDVLEGLVFPKLFFCKHLSLVVKQVRLKNNENGHKKYFWPPGCFRIEGRKQQNSDFQSHFSMLKIDQILLNFFFH